MLNKHHMNSQHANPDQNSIKQLHKTQPMSTDMNTNIRTGDPYTAVGN